MIEPTYNYQVHDGLNIMPSVDTSLIISSMRKKSKLVCLAVCNLNQECLTSVYMESEENDNCILYKKHFDLTETTKANNSKLFIKTSKI